MVGNDPQVRHPLSQFVLKVHSRCDLACDHCYVYEHADQGWRRMPGAMSVDTARAAAARIAEYAAATQLPRVHVALHGGEPLLLGVDRLGETIRILRHAVSEVSELDLAIQTNGVRLTPEFCDMFLEHRVRLGVSLDGDRTANDRHRLFRRGASSYDHVRRALALLRQPKYRPIYAGILCTVDVRNDPIAVYRALVAEQPPRVDFLLPHATWATPPWRPDADPTPYATWLGVIHARWIADGEALSIRMFEALRDAGRGRPSGVEWAGLDPVGVVVIETDGSWEQADSLKTAYDGAPWTGMDVFRHGVAEVAALPEIARRQGGLSDLCDLCRQCPVVQQCGGGLLAHRYDTVKEFDNPSVYCADLKALIMTINSSSPPVGDADPAEVPGIPDEWFEHIATGPAGGAAVAFLAGAELSITRALLSAVAEADETSNYLHVLAELESVAPAAAAQVLRHPYLRSWAVGRLAARPVTGRAVLGWITAATAVATGAELELRVDTIGGRIHLPRVGTVEVDADSAIVVAAAGRFTVHAGASTPVVRPARSVRLDSEPVQLEDQDPYRDVHDWPVAARLGATELAEWARCIPAAWAEIEADAPDYAPGLRTGLQAIVPLQIAETGEHRSSTSRHAFGSVAAALAPPDAMAVMLVHEFQHNVLGAVLDLVELFDPSNRLLLRVGWRPDPRPVEGVLQGTYAHLAVAEMWRARAERHGSSAAHSQFTTYHSWTRSAIEALLTSGALTAVGERFVAIMAKKVENW